MKRLILALCNSLGIAMMAVAIHQDTLLYLVLGSAMVTIAYIARPS